MVDDDIRSAFGREPLDLENEVLRLVVDDVIRPEALCTFGLGVAAGGCDDARSVKLRDLDRGARDSASSGVYEDRLSCAHTTLVDHHLPTRQKDQRYGGP